MASIGALSLENSSKAIEARYGTVNFLVQLIERQRREAAGAAFKSPQSRRSHRRAPPGTGAGRWGVGGSGSAPP